MDVDTIFITIASIATAIFLILSIFVIISSRKQRRAAIDRFHYRPRKQLMVGSQKHCFQLLNDIFGGRFYIIPDVSLSALLSHKVGNQNRHEAYSFIENKTVDFVFCNKRTIRPVCAVKLDDGTKSKNDIGSDPKDMEKFFRSARLPFVRIEKPAKLDRQTIIEEFSRVIYETSIIEPKKPRSKSNKS